MVGPEDPADPNGASAVTDVSLSLMHGHYHRLPAGTSLPEGLSVVADGSDVNTASRHGPGHHTIYPATAMLLNEFIELFENLPWKYGGKK